MKNQSGFTLIEMIVVIIVIGIISVIALPRFIDISDDAKVAVADGMAASFESSIKLARSKHVIENEQGFIVIDGSAVLFHSVFL
jgi:MSHA pilin protein MshA